MRAIIVVDFVAPHMDSRTEEFVFCAIVFGLPAVVGILALVAIFWLTHTYNLSDGTMISLTGLVVFGLPKLLWGDP